MKKFYFLLAILITKTVASQTISDLIPANTSYVFSLNFAQLNAKANQLDYSKLLTPIALQSNRYRYSYDNNGSSNCTLIDIDAFIKNPLGYGVNLNSNFYTYPTTSGARTGTMYLFELADEKLFISNLNLNCEDSGFVMKDENNESKTYYAQHSAIGITGKIAAIYIQDYYYDYSSYSYPSTETSETTEEVMAVDTSIPQATPNNSKLNQKEIDSLEYQKRVEEEIERKKAAELKKKEEAYGRRKSKNEELQLIFMPMLNFNGTPITKNLNFNALNIGKHDAFMYMNNVAYYTNKWLAYFSILGSNSSVNPENKAKPVLTKDWGNSYTLDFEKGNVVLKMCNYYNKDMAPYIVHQSKTTQSKKLFKYIEGENLLGYVSMAYNLDGMGKLYESLLKKFQVQSPLTRESSYFIPTIQLFYSFLDKEMLFNSFTGHAIVACTGFHDVNTTYNSYEMDSNFQYNVRVIDTVQKQPKMVFVSAIKNQANAHKFFEIISGYPVFEKINDHLFMISQSVSSSVKVYFAITKDALIITNDFELVMNHLNGFEKSRQISKKEIKEIKKHNLVMKVNTHKTLDAANAAYFKNGKSLPIFDSLILNMGDLIVYDEKPTTTKHTATAVFQLNNTNESSLFLLLEMMSKLK